MMTTTSMNIKQVAANRPRIMPTPEEIRKSELEKSTCLYVFLVYIFKHQISKGMKFYCPTKTCHTKPPVANLNNHLMKVHLVTSPTLRMALLAEACLNASSSIALKKKMAKKNRKEQPSITEFFS